MKYQKNYLNCYCFQFIQVRVSLLLLVFNTFFLDLKSDQILYLTKENIISLGPWTAAKTSDATAVSAGQVAVILFVLWWEDGILFEWVSFFGFYISLKNIWLHNLCGMNFIKWLTRNFVIMFLPELVVT